MLHHRWATPIQLRCISIVGHYFSWKSRPRWSENEDVSVIIIVIHRTTVDICNGSTKKITQNGLKVQRSETMLESAWSRQLCKKQSLLHVRRHTHHRILDSLRRRVAYSPERIHPRCTIHGSRRWPHFSHQASMYGLIVVFELTTPWRCISSIESEDSNLTFWHSIPSTVSS